MGMLRKGDEIIRVSSLASSTCFPACCHHNITAQQRNKKKRKEEKEKEDEGRALIHDLDPTTLVPIRSTTLTLRVSRTQPLSRPCRRVSALRRFSSPVQHRPTSAPPLPVPVVVAGAAWGLSRISLRRRLHGSSVLPVSLHSWLSRGGEGRVRCQLCVLRVLRVCPCAI